MPCQTYDIIFSGQMLEGIDPEHARQQIGAIFKTNDNQLERLFSGKPVLIKSGVDDETATKYRVAFRQAGALIDIRPTPPSIDDTKATAAQTKQYQEATEELTLLPPNTGSLIDCARKVAPQPIPDIGYMTLASPGTIIDEAPDPEPADIDTGSLSLNPPNTGTLEDCKKEAEPYPIPDISHLDLDNP